MAVSAGKVSIEADVVLGDQATRVLALGLAVEYAQSYRNGAPSAASVLESAKKFETYIKGARQ